MFTCSCLADVAIQTDAAVKFLPVERVFVWRPDHSHSVMCRGGRVPETVVKRRAIFPFPCGPFNIKNSKLLTTFQYNYDIFMYLVKQLINGYKYSCVPHMGGCNII